MSNAALAFLAGLGGGYLQEKDNQEKKARQDKIDQRDQEEHDARMAERRVKIDGDKALAAAGRQATVLAGANGVTLPASADNRDVGQPDGPTAANGQLQAGVRVGDQAYTDPAAATAAAASMNQPQAVRARQVAALQGIDPERALKLQATTLQVDAAQQEQARKLKDEGVFDTVQAARRGDAQAVFDSFNKNGAFKLQGVPTVTPVDRDIPGIGTIRTYTYSGTLVGPDGTTQPFQKNSHDLSMEVMPYEKALDLQNKATKTSQEGKKIAAEADESSAKAGYYKSAAGEKDYKANGGTGGKPYKLDEDDKLRLTNVAQSVRDAQKAVGEAMGKLMPGDDPTKSPGVVYANQQLREAKLAHLKTNIELGQIPAASMVTQVLGAAKTPQDVMTSLNELASIAGTDYADQVAAGIQKTDAWARLSPAPKAAPKPAAAAGMMVGPPAPAANAAPAAARGMPAASNLEAAANAADASLKAARDKLRTYGLAQRQKDPQGYAEAQSALAAAEKDQRAADAAYRASVGGVQPAFVAARP